MSSKDPVTGQAPRPSQPDNLPAPDADNWTHVATAARRMIAEAMRNHHGDK